MERFCPCHCKFVSMVIVQGSICGESRGGVSTIFLTELEGSQLKSGGLTKPEEGLNPPTNRALVIVEKNVFPCDIKKL